MTSLKKALTVFVALPILSATSVAKADTPILDTLIENIHETVKNIPIDTPELPEKRDAYALTMSLRIQRQLIAEKIKEVNEKRPSKAELTRQAERLEKERLEQEHLEQERLEQERLAQERLEQERLERERLQPKKVAETPQSIVTPNHEGLRFGQDGLLIEEATGRAQEVINRLLSIPGHANGQYYHNNGLDDLINQLSTAEAVYVIHRIEGAGFGQTGDGYAGYDTPESHRVFVQNQVNGRFGGSVHALLRAWGTFSYGGY